MDLFVDTSRSALVISPASARQALPPTLVVGDTVPVTLSFLQRNPQPLNTGYPVFNYLDKSAAGVVLSIGREGGLPTSGTFPLTFGANTATINYNSSAYVLQDALNALASVVSAGGVTVTGNLGGPYTISFVNNGAQSLFTSGANALFPAATVTITSDKAGTSTSTAVQVVTLLCSPAVQVSSWTAQSAAAVTVTQISGNLIQRVSIPAGTYGGTFTLTYNGNTTAAIPFAAQIDVVAAAMNAIPGLSGVTVWPGQNFWDISIPSGAFTLTGNASGLVIPLVLSGSLPLTSQSVADLLAGGSSVSTGLYIQSTASTVQTLFAGNVTLHTP